MNSEKRKSVRFLETGKTCWPSFGQSPVPAAMSENMRPKSRLTYLSDVTMFIVKPEPDRNNNVKIIELNNNSGERWLWTSYCQKVPPLTQLQGQYKPSLTKLGKSSEALFSLCIRLFCSSKHFSSQGFWFFVFPEDGKAGDMPRPTRKKQ